MNPTDATAVGKQSILREYILSRINLNGDIPKTNN